VLGALGVHVNLLFQGFTESTENKPMKLYSKPMSWGMYSTVFN